MTTGAPARKRGEWDPPREATSASAPSPRGRPAASFSARRAQTASLLAPPRPDPGGILFVIEKRAPPLHPDASANAAAARITRFVPSVGTDGSSLATENEEPPTSTQSVSPHASGAATDTMSWNPSGRRPVTARKRLILAGACRALGVTVPHRRQKFTARHDFPCGARARGPLTLQPPQGGIRSTMSRTAVILLAAGSGKRMAGAVPDKVLATVAGKPVFAYSAAAFAASGVADLYVVVYRDLAQMTALSAFAPTPSLLVRGGRKRQDSVAAALAALPGDIGYVFIHDCARPLISPEQLVALHKIVRREGAVVLAHRLTDTIKERRGRRRLRTVDRSRLWAMETPQVFSRYLIYRAYG